MGLNHTSEKWKVDGTAIYVPSSITVEHDNVVSSDSGRTESGKMYINWVRRDVRKVKLTYEHITGAEVAFLHGLMQGREFVFTYEDNGVKTMEGYAGKDSYTQKNLNNYVSEGGEYTDYSISVVEI